MKVRKKPVVVEAWPVREVCRAFQHEWDALPQPIVDAYNSVEVLFVADPDRIEIITLEGVMRADLDDWIICGVKGELYPCKPDIFEATYEVSNE